jgi:hypothetical protein
VAAGKASPASRRATSRATVSPPPAESPATAIDRAPGSWSARSQRHAARTSSMAAEKGCSGARRYSGTVPAFRWPVPAGRPARRRCEASRARNLRRAGRWSTRPVSVPGASNQWAGTPPAVTSVTRTSSGTDEGGPRGEGGTALLERRRGLAGTGLLPVPEDVDQVLHGLTRHVGISFGQSCLATQQPYGTPGTSLSASPAPERPSRSARRGGGVANR